MTPGLEPSPPPPSPPPRAMWGTNLVSHRMAAASMPQRGASTILTVIIVYFNTESDPANN